MVHPLSRPCGRPTDTLFHTCPQAQTPEQRRRNAKFQKDQEARRGKAETDIKQRVKEVHKSPISPVWLGTSLSLSLSLRTLRKPSATMRLRAPWRLQLAKKKRNIS